MATRIEWCDETWNPVTGCSKVSAGCKHCYAEREWTRLQHLPTYKGRAFTDVACHPERLDQPLRWRRPRRIFVNSMSDLFHPDVPSDFIMAVFCVMAQASHHVFQVLTKRPNRMLDLLTLWAKTMTFPSTPRAGILPNVWLGVSVEDQATVDERIPLLLQTPAAVRWVSAEPLLGPIDLCRLSPDDYVYDLDALDPESNCGSYYETVSLDWLVVGGESGPKARPMVLAWAKDIVRQCQAHGIPVLMKQVGRNPMNREGTPHKISDRKGAIMEDWPEMLRIREYPNVG